MSTESRKDGFYWANRRTTDWHSERFGVRQVVWWNSLGFDVEIEYLDADVPSRPAQWTDFSERLETPPDDVPSVQVAVGAGWWWGFDTRRGSWRPFFVELEESVAGPTLRRIRQLGSDDWVRVDRCARWTPLAKDQT